MNIDKGDVMHGVVMGSDDHHAGVDVVASVMADPNWGLPPGKPRVRVLVKGGTVLTPTQVVQLRELLERAMDHLGEAGQEEAHDVLYGPVFDGAGNRLR